MEKVISNHVILNSILKNVSSPTDLKCCRLVNHTWNNLVLSISPPRMTLSLERLIKGDNLNFDERLARKILQEESPKCGDLLEVYSSIVESLVIAKTSFADLSRVFHSELFPNLRILSLRGKELEEVLEGGGWKPSDGKGITSLCLSWVKSSYFEKISGIFPNLTRLEVGVKEGGEEGGVLLGGIIQEIGGGGLKLRHLHLHLPYCMEMDWTGLVDMMTNAKKESFKGLQTLQFEVHPVPGPDSQNIIYLQNGVSTRDLDELKRNFGGLKEIRFTNFVWIDDNQNGGKGTGENGRKPKVIFDTKAPDSLNLTVLTRSKFKVQVTFTRDEFENLHPLERFKHLYKYNY